MLTHLAVISDSDVIIFGFAFLFIFVAIIVAFFWGAWIKKHSVALSPYTGHPLRRASELPYESARKVLKFLYDRHEYDNRIFDIKRASFCRETGRIFPDTVSWLDTIHVDWNFLRKRFPGNFVSWGSLTEVQQSVIQKAHESLEGFQVEYSSSKYSPSAIESEYLYTKPGPLYVDMDAKVLLGWQCVPDTDLEVLIVQKPKYITGISVE